MTWARIIATCLVSGTWAAMEGDDAFSSALVSNPDDVAYPEFDPLGHQDADEIGVHCAVLGVCVVTTFQMSQEIDMLS